MSGRRTSTLQPKVHVYVQNRNNRSETFIGALDATNLRHFSYTARRQINTNNDLILGYRKCNPLHARTICTWMENNDINDPSPLPLEAVGYITFRDMIDFYATLSCFDLDYKLRYLNRNIRGWILDYIKKEPLTKNEFRSIADDCYDGDLRKEAMKQTILWSWSGTGVPELQNIIAFCKTRGYYREMLALKRRLRSKTDKEKGRHQVLERLIDESEGTTVPHLRKTKSLPDMGLREKQDNRIWVFPAKEV
ncbi:Hypothetical predicted protein [Lecanosticta acicola]|uniref:Uncharacterized protein n=1 Tax=Lecanosticta acicola TaxID=111012 RepID=A0AAI8Z9I6_9PEZI|nr:Hypothetical predicted protein [Lecanosticta acicola]